jgi:peptide/nickel transport system substrate-binding protein
MLVGSGAVGVGAVGLALVGCGDDDDDDTGGGADPTATTGGGADPTATSGGAEPTAEPTMDPNAPVVGGIARYPLEGVSSGDPPTIYPFENLTYLAQHPSGLHYGRLLKSFADGVVGGSDFATALDGDVAAGLPEQPDGVTYIFKLKSGVFWHDKEPMNGRAATMADFADTYQAFLQASPNAGTFEAVVDKLEATDDETLVVTLNNPYAPFLTTHASSPEGVHFIPVETIINDQVQTDPVGTGQYVFDEWETGVAMRWHRNDNYADNPIPYAAGVEASLNNDAQRILEGLAAGDLDWSLLGGNLYDQASADLDPAGTEYFLPTGVLGSYVFNFDNESWGDTRLRQALSMAWNRDDTLEVLDQTGRGTWQSTLSPALEPYFLDPSKPDVFGPQSKWYTKNIAEAKKLMIAATGSDTVKMKVTSNVDRYGSGAQALWELQASLIAEAGFESEIVFQEYGAYIASAYQGKMPEGIMLGPLIGSPRDPNDIYSRMYESTSARTNWGGTPIPEMPEIDANIAKQREFLDLEERIAFIHDMQRSMAESMIIVPYQGGASFGYHNSWVKGFYEKNGYAVHRASYAGAWFTEERRARDA